MADYTKMGLLFILLGNLISLVGIIPAENIAILVAIGMVSVVALILILAGFIFIVAGRKEFGEEHAKSVIRAVILFVTSIAISALAVTLGVIMMVNSVVGARAVFYALGFTSSILGVFFMYYLVIHLQDGFGRKVLVAGVIISLCAYALFAVTGGMMHWEEDRADDRKERQEIQDSYEPLTWVYVGLLLVSSILFLLAVYNAYKRIQRGDLVPIQPAPAYYYYPYPCPTCGRPLEVLHGHHKWWCENCGRSW